jgi:hypothetical protein
MPFTPDSPAAPLAAPTSQDQGPNPHQAPQQIPYWLQQTERFVRLYLGLLVGLFVCCAPWCSPFWDNNPLFASSPWLTAFVTHGAVRGIVSGLGILNLWFTVRLAFRSTADPDTQ